MKLYNDWLEQARRYDAVVDAGSPITAQRSTHRGYSPAIQPMQPNYGYGNSHIPHQNLPHPADMAMALWRMVNDPYETTPQKP